ncbi:hypothetical protein P8452_10016 [Trifolium repens]|nr:hypothetical protein P8452_10016 [Trifolium repens]
MSSVKHFCLVKYMFNELLRGIGLIHFPDVGAEYTHMLQMLRRVLIIIFIKYTDVYLSSMLYVAVFMFVARCYS